MKGHGQKLSRRQEQAIAALLTCPTLAEAATAAGISEPTLWRWLARPDFQDAYRTARREAVSQAVAHLQQASTEAVETLRRIMQDPEKSVTARVTAARTVLEFAIKGVELEDLAARIAALERRGAGEGHGPWRPD